MDSGAVARLAARRAATATAVRQWLIAPAVAGWPATLAQRERLLRSYAGQMPMMPPISTAYATR